MLLIMLVSMVTLTSCMISTHHWDKFKLLLEIDKRYIDIKENPCVIIAVSFIRHVLSFHLFFNENGIMNSKKISAY
jgi:hypothetical protein